jgi:hypothetical protein
MLIKVLIFVGVAVALLGLLWIFQRSFIYMPIGVPGRPAEDGLPRAETVSLATEDGLSLGAWALPPPGSRAAPWVVVFNGNAGNRAIRAPLAAGLERLGCGVLLFDYRGYGGNQGRPSETGLARDARAARAYLAGRPDVDARRLVYFGESLGTGVAVSLALEHPPAALVLRSPFTSAVDVGQRQFPFLPLRWMMWDQYQSIERIGRIRCPLLVIAGARDTVVPYALSVRVYEAAPQPKRLVTLQADHNDYEMLAGEVLLGAIGEFLAGAIQFRLNLETADSGALR